MTTTTATSHQVTEWSHPHEPIDTQWGRVLHAHWLQLESDRWLELNFRRAYVRENPEGLVALFTDENIRFTGEE